MKRILATFVMVGFLGLTACSDGTMSKRPVTESTPSVTAPVVAPPAVESPKIKELKILSFVSKPGKIHAGESAQLCWTLSDPDATATVTPGDLVPTVLKAQSLLLTAKSDETCGYTVTPAQTTTYTLTAVAGDQQVSQDYTLEVEPTVQPTQPPVVDTPPAPEEHKPVIKVTARSLTPSVFAGEVAKIEFTTDGPFMNVSVVDAQGNAPQFSVSEKTITISNPVSGNYTVAVDGNYSNTVQVEVKSFKIRSTSPANGLALTSMQSAVAGYDNGGTESSDGSTYTLNIGMIRVLGEDLDKVNESKTDIAGGLAKLINVEFNPKQFSLFGSFPVRVVRADVSNLSRLFVGTTGALLYSHDDGQSWSVVDPLLIFDNAHQYATSNESHPGCAGSTQVGTKYSEVNGALVGMSQICDIYVDGKYAIIATDQGTYHIDNIEGRLSTDTRRANPWQTGLKNKVVNKLAAVKTGSGTTVYAATSDGIYIYTKGKAASEWQPMSAGALKSAGSINTVVVSGNTLYAGTDTGLFKSNGLELSNVLKPVISVLAPTPLITPSVKENQTAVKALAVDAADPATLYMGTDNGFKLSRDCGAHFVDVASDVGTVRNIATATVGEQAVVVLTSTNGLFVAKGTIGSTGNCASPVTPTQ